MNSISKKVSENTDDFTKEEASQGKAKVENRFQAVGWGLFVP